MSSSSSETGSGAAARRGSKAPSTAASSPAPATSPAAAPRQASPRASPEPESGCLSVELVNASEALMHYTGDIRDGLIDLLDHIEEGEMVPDDRKDKPVQLMHAVVEYVEFCAAKKDSEAAMRETLEKIKFTFDDVVFRMDRGSPYQKVMNWCAMQRSKREKKKR